MQPLSFRIEKKVAGALTRAGSILTAHGKINTPAFIPVGTKATIKSLTPEQVKNTGAQALLVNTYHLYLQPGDELIRDAGGLHKFMNWEGPIMADSGGFQVFSLGAAYGLKLSKIGQFGRSDLPSKSDLGKELSKVVSQADPNPPFLERADEALLPRLAKIGEDGVSFKSHLDGSVHFITPEKSIEIQHNFGADIIFAFDECTSPAEDLRYQREALERTHRWALRSLEHHRSLIRANKRIDVPALFGIVQGGRHEDLRKKSATIISGMNFDGFGIGGSFAKEDMSNAVKWVNEILPEDKPRHLLGIGEPEDLFTGVLNGVDLFDCVAPTRNARNGTLYTAQGKINITNAQFTKDFSPIESGCECYTCKNYTRSYLSHLFRGKEMLAGTLATIHNLFFILHLVGKMRQVILEDNFFDFREDFLKNYVRE
ncbi:tRNA guanosine(34) transglycosylase Tgt [Patescibacteria group bacterium]|nr:MAG: tRNA guanosine(34) transglycosylase Tgt [Patescibacteria group bacterium]